MKPYPLAEVERGYADFDVHMTALVKQARVEGHMVPCKRGCSACCYDVALVNQFEMAPIIEKIRAMDPAEQAVIRAALAAWCANMTAKGLSVDNAEPPLSVYHAHPKAACPLLDEAKGECKVYGARPGACRAHVVIDQEAAGCANRQNVPEVQNLVVEEPLSRLLSFVITRVVRKHKSSTVDVQLAIIMLPAMLMRAWVLVEHPDMTHEEWLESLAQRAARGARI